MMEVAALGHLRILELGGGTALSYAGKLLGDYGADVVKVEPPGGDPERGRWPSAGAPGESSPVFDYFNQNKRSCIVDCRRDPGRAAVLSLLKWADALITSIPALEAQGQGFVRDHIEGPAGHDFGHGLDFALRHGGPVCHVPGERADPPGAWRIDVAHGLQQS